MYPHLFFLDPPIPQFLDDFHYDRPLFVFFDPYLFFFDPSIFFFDPYLFPFLIR